MNFDTESTNGSDIDPSMRHWSCRCYLVGVDGKAMSDIPEGAAVYNADTSNKELQALDEKYQKVLAEIVESRK